MNAKKFEFKEGMTIDTEICTVDNVRFTFGDCLKLVSLNISLEYSNQRLREELLALENAEQ